MTDAEWDQCDWIEITSTEDAKDGLRAFIRGVKYTQPPNDGFHYEEVTKLGDEEQKWKRAKRPLDNP